MIVVTKDLYTLRSWEGQDTESLTLHLNNKKIWDNCRDGLPHPYTKENARCFVSMRKSVIGSVRDIGTKGLPLKR